MCVPILDFVVPARVEPSLNVERQTERETERTISERARESKEEGGSEQQTAPSVAETAPNIWYTILLFFDWVIHPVIGEDTTICFTVTVTASFSHKEREGGSRCKNIIGTSSSVR